MMFKQKKLRSFLSGPFFKNGRYSNFEGESKKGFLVPSLQMYLTSMFKRWRHSSDTTNYWSAEPTVNKNNLPAITWIGHASFLIQIDKIAILTDPIFGNASWLFKRTAPPGVALVQLPHIDYVLISHNHRDHLDKESVVGLYKQSNPVFLVPEGTKGWFLNLGISKVVEHSWWQTYASDLNIHLKFVFLPAYHWSQRGLFDKNKSLWGSWLINDSNHSIYFAGDTGYEGHFKEIGERYAIDYALLPIGPGEPHKWLCHSHLNADQAGQAFLDLKANSFIPMHWGTFHFGTDMVFEPLIKLRSWWHANVLRLVDKQLYEIKMGQSIQIPHRYYQDQAQQDRPEQ